MNLKNISMNGVWAGWRNKRDRKKARGSQTPGNQKILSCRHRPPKKYLATRSRSYKHPSFKDWKSIFGRR